MKLEINDYFEDEAGNKYQIVHKNRDEITTLIRTDRDVIVQLKHKNFFESPTMKPKIGSPFYNMKNIKNLFNGILKDVTFLGYIKYYNRADDFEKRKAHYVYELLFQSQDKILSLMISVISAFNLLKDRYYLATWGYNLEKEFVSFTEVEKLDKNSIGGTTAYTVIKQPLSVKIEKDSITLNDMIRINTNNTNNQVQELELDDYCYVLEDKKEFLDRIGGIVEIEETEE